MNIRPGVFDQCPGRRDAADLVGADGVGGTGGNACPQDAALARECLAVSAKDEGAEGDVFARSVLGFLLKNDVVPGIFAVEEAPAFSGGLVQE